MRAAELIEQTGSTVFEPHVHLARAELAKLLGDDARRHLREAHRLFTEMGATGHAERVARKLTYQRSMHLRPVPDAECPKPTARSGTSPIRSLRDPSRDPSASERGRQEPVSP